MLTAFVSWANDSKLMIYRNDNKFNNINLVEGTSINHSINGDMLSIKVNNQEIPITVIDSCVIRNSDIPTLFIKLKDAPYATQVWSKDEYTNATIEVSGNGMTDDTDILDLSIKGRGNSTWCFPKKPMRLKFDKKTSLCGFPKAKSYVLLANYLDASLMRNVITLWLADRLGMPYSNHFMPCNVVINDNYIGSFLLTEKIGLNSGSINDINENEGVLLEVSVEYDEKYKFKTTPYSLPVMIKDPDFDELYCSNPSIPPEMRLKLWEEDFNRAVKAANFDEFDLSSFVDFELIVSFAQNPELGYPKSLYIHKANLDTSTKYIFGPVWDFDVAYNFLTPDDNSYKIAQPAASTWHHPFLVKLRSNKAFRDVYTERFEYFEKEILPELLEFIDNYALIIEPSAKMDGIRWPDITSGSWYYRIPTYDNKDQYTALKEWIIARVKAMRNNLPNPL